MVRHIAFAVALGCAVTAGPCYANEDFVEVKGRVSYAGLDLDQPSDIVEFNKRVARTAETICRKDVPRDLHYSPLVKECRASVVASGRQRLAELRDLPASASGINVGE